MRNKLAAAAVIAAAVSTAACSGSSSTPAASGGGSSSAGSAAATTATSAAATSAATGSSSSGASSASATTAATPSSGAASVSAAGPAPADGAAKISFQSAQTKTDGAGLLLSDLTTKYAATAPGKGSSIKEDYLSTGIDQKTQLLAGQNALPTIFHIGTPDLAKQLYKSGKIVDLEPIFKQLGVWDQIDPTAAATLKQLYGGHLLALPTELNIEGFWYNKKLFAQAGITSAPTTWDQLVADAATLKSKNIQPFEASGKQGWPITRLVSGYLYRTLGTDAMNNITSGKAKLTDPQYVKAAQAVADLGSKGYFGKGYTSVDYQPAEDLFLQGKAAIYYMGSWALRDYNNSTLDKIGETNIGFFPFPTVAGGSGNINQTPVNGGQPVAVSSKGLTPQVKAWLKYVAQNYGDDAMQKLGQITGFKVNSLPSNVSQLTKDALQQVTNTTNGVAWFEAAFSAKATSISQTNAAGLLSGSMSPQKFMSTVQASLGSS